VARGSLSLAQPYTHYDYDAPLENILSVIVSLSQAILKEADFELVGSDSYAARFGETIINLGDIDDDGYPGIVYLIQQYLSLYKPSQFVRFL